MEKGYTSNSAQPLKELSQSLSDLVQAVSKSLVQVRAEDAETRTGVKYDEHHVLTAAVYAAENETVTVRELTSTPGVGGAKSFRDIEAKVVGQDPSTGLVLLKIETALTIAGFTLRADSLPVHVGELAVSVAIPSYDGVEAKLEMIRCAGGTWRGQGGEIPGYFQTDAPLFPGFAGSPVVDVDGSLIGIRAAGSGPMEIANGGLIIPAPFAFETAARIAEHKLPVRGYLGIRSQEVELSVGLAKKLGRTQATGLLVISVEPGSPAETAGLVTGDILTAVASHPVTSHEELLEAMDKSGTGAPVELEILRGGELSRVQATPEAVPRDAGFAGHRWGGGWRHGAHQGARRMRRWFQSGTAG
ncbi:MAG TPA: S1C family serine protease [Spirochaetia bacterium]|nr:S1C family serine protease [Spirochaetia bacterium]